jgi:hypothetical protein
MLTAGKPPAYAFMRPSPPRWKGALHGTEILCPRSTVFDGANDHCAVYGDCVRMPTQEDA